MICSNNILQALHVVTLARNGDFQEFYPSIQLCYHFIGLLLLLMQVFLHVPSLVYCLLLFLSHGYFDEYPFLSTGSM